MRTIIIPLMVQENECINKTDEELARLAIDNEDYFLYLMKRYEQKLLAYIMRISNISFEEAEDILQEVFIKVYLNLNDFNTNLKFSSWIYRITHNQVISNYRKIKARPEHINIEDNDYLIKNLSSDFDISKELDQQILKEKVKKILEAMDIKYREVLILKYLEGRDYEEISDILTKPLGTVATLINRAKKRFKQEMEKQNIKL